MSPTLKHYAAHHSPQHPVEKTAHQARQRSRHIPSVHNGRQRTWARHPTTLPTHGITDTTTLQHVHSFQHTNAPPPIPSTHHHFTSTPIGIHQLTVPRKKGEKRTRHRHHPPPTFNTTWHSSSKDVFYDKSKTYQIKYTHHTHPASLNTFPPK